MEKTKRNSNIELLRIFCMFFLILHHCTLHGGAVLMETHINKEIALFFIPAGKIAFDTFIAISMYFLVDQSFRAKKFLKIWILVLFYSVLFTLVSIILGSKISFGSILASFFPIIGNAHGFAAAYLAFYLFIPFLYKISTQLSKFQIKWIITVLFICEIATQMFGSITGYFQILYNELILFILCYFISLYLKRYPWKILNNKLVLIIIVICIYGLRYSITYIQTDSFICQKIFYFINANIGDESSIFNIVAGYALFYYFINLKVPNSKIINKIATIAFPVLLIHDHNVFRSAIWSVVYKCQTWYYSSYFLLLLFAVAISIYIAAYCIEYFRRKIIEEPLLKNSLIEKYCERIDTLIN